MEIKEFIEKSGKIFDDTDVASLTPETHFLELDEWSSLSALGLIATADEEPLVSKPKDACAIENRRVAFMYNADMGLIELVEK